LVAEKAKKGKKKYECQTSRVKLVNVKALARRGGRKTQEAIRFTVRGRYSQKKPSFKNAGGLQRGGAILGETPVLTVNEDTCET